MSKKLVLLLMFLLVIPIMVSGDEDDGEEEIGEATGSLALIFLGIGSGYIGLKVLQILIKKLDDEEYESQKTSFKEFYKRVRRPLLIIHNFAMLTATLVAIFHGIILFEGWGGTEITGLIAVILMVVLSIFGAILFYRFRPLWNHSPSRRFIRIVHRQWFLSIFLLIFLLIHIE